jgi:nucleoside phosphorylase
VLLVVATDVERDILLEHAKNRSGRAHSLRFGHRRTYFDLGEIGGARLALVQCEMGSGAPGASLPTASDAIDELKPSSVVMVGIAFGVDSAKQKIGDILVSRQLRPYELQRVGTDKFGNLARSPRGDRVTASTKLIGRLRASTPDWKGASVRFGLVLSGEKLVDNIDFRDPLRRFEPEALGGEMEGAGLYTASSERKIDWTSTIVAVNPFGKKYLKTEADRRNYFDAARVASTSSHVDWR